MVKNLWVFAGCVALFCNAAFAQTPRPPELQLRFTVFSARPVTDLAYTVGSGAAIKTAPMQFYPTARSPRYDYHGPSPLRFFDTKSGALAAEAEISPEVKEPLLIFSPQSPNAPGRLRYHITVFDDAAARYGAGKLMILNFSGLKLAGAIDRRKVELADGPNGPFAVGRSAQVQFRTQFRGKSYQSYAGTLELGAKGRALLILLPPYYRGSLEVQTRLLIEETAPSP